MSPPALPELENLSPIKRVVPSNQTDISFTPMSYSIIDRDESSILRKYNVPCSDATLIGIEQSNISWQLPSQELSLFSHVPSSFPKQNANQLNHHKTQKQYEPSNCSFTPMGYSILDKDEASILKKYNLPSTDATLAGIESSNIPWQLPASDLSLFSHIPSSFEPKKIDFDNTTPPQDPCSEGILATISSLDQPASQDSLIQELLALPVGDLTLSQDCSQSLSANGSPSQKKTSSVITRLNNQPGNGKSAVSPQSKNKYLPGGLPSNLNVDGSPTLNMGSSKKSTNDLNGDASFSIPSCTEIMEILRRLPKELSDCELADHLLGISSGETHSSQKAKVEKCAVLDESSTVPSLTSIMNKLKKLPNDLSESVLADRLMNMTDVSNQQ